MSEMNNATAITAAQPAQPSWVRIQMVEGRRRLSHHSIADLMFKYPGDIARLIRRFGTQHVELVDHESTRDRTGRPTKHYWLTCEQAVAFLHAWGKTHWVSAVLEAFELEAAREAKLATEALADQRTKTLVAVHLKAERTFREKATELEITKLDLEGRLELQNRHLERHAQFTRECDVELKKLRREAAGWDALEKSYNQQFEALTKRVKELQTKLDLQNSFAPPRVLNFTPLFKYARPGWFSHRTTENDPETAARVENFRAQHGLELLSELGLCSRAGVPTETGRRYSKPDGLSFKWDMGLLSLMGA